MGAKRSKRQFRRATRNVVLFGLFILLTLLSVAETRSQRRTRKPTTQVTAPDKPGLLNEATALLQAGRVAEAEAATRKVLTIDSHNAEAHALLGVILDKRGVLAEAEQEYLSALRIRPN